MSADRPTSELLPARTDAITAVLSCWFTAGLFLDAWAHNNVPRLETFFTPWHAVFYSGFTATAAWLVWTVRGQLRDLRGWSSLPAGYAVTMPALIGFAVFGVADYLWHNAFGIEQTIDILFSPTHVGLLAAMLIIVTLPLRSALAVAGDPVAPPLRRLLPAVVAMALATAQVLLFGQYANGLAYTADNLTFGLSNLDHEFTARLMASMAVTTVVLVAPLLYLAKHWVLPPGTVTIVYLACGGLSAAVTGFANLPVIGALVLGGVGAELLVRALRPGPGRRHRTLVFAAVTPALTWGLIIVVARLASSTGGAAGLIAGGHSTLLADLTLQLSLGAPLVQGGIGLLAGVLIGTPTRSTG